MTRLWPRNLAGQLVLIVLTAILAGQIPGKRQAIIEMLESVSGDLTILAETLGEIARQMHAREVREARRRTA